MVALGILAGTWVAARLAKKRGQNPQMIWDLAATAALAGIVCGRLFHVVFYDPSFYLAQPLKIFAMWDGGISITGSLLGAAGAAFCFLKTRKLPMMAYMDTIAYGSPLAYAIGRIGCFLIHDHPGTLTHFVLGVRYPDGAVRHDLGLYEALNGLGLFLLFLVLHRRGAKAPTYAIIALIWYGLLRFLLDFLRVNDARYFSLTPAQYLAAGMFLGGCAWALKRKRL